MGGVLKYKLHCFSESNRRIFILLQYIDRMAIIQALSSMGFLLSAYSLRVKFKARSKHYKALCDIRDNISCSKAFTSKYGSIVFVPNSVFGLLFYPLLFYLASAGELMAVRYLSAAAVLGSFYLAYLLFRTKNYCVVCISIYATNIFIFLTFQRLRVNLFGILMSLG